MQKFACLFTKSDFIYLKWLTLGILIDFIIATAEVLFVDNVLWNSKATHEASINVPILALPKFRNIMDFSPKDLMFYEIKDGQAEV